MARLLHFAAAVALGGLATAGLTACTGDAEASSSPTPLVTVSTEAPSPTPTLTAEEELLAQIPEDARAEGFVEATNFVAFFVDESQAILETRDPALFKFLSGPDCGFCASRLETLNRLEAEGKTAEGGEISLNLDTLTGGLRDDGTWNVTVDVHVEPQFFLAADGSVADEFGADDLQIAVSLAYVEDHFVVLGIGS